MTCLVSGSWSTRPTCIGTKHQCLYLRKCVQLLSYACYHIFTVVNCGPPPSIPNGSPGTPTRTTYGGTVAYSCNHGYELSGSATVTCLASGSWSTRPTCIGTKHQCYLLKRVQLCKTNLHRYKTPMLLTKACSVMQDQLA